MTTRAKNPTATRPKTASVIERTIPAIDHQGRGGVRFDCDIPRILLATWAPVLSTDTQIPSPNQSCVRRVKQTTTDASVPLSFWPERLPVHVQPPQPFPPHEWHYSRRNTVIMRQASAES